MINGDNNEVKKLKHFVYCLEIYSLAQITINPAKNVKVNSKIHIVLPEKLIGILMSEPKNHASISLIQHLIQRLDLI